MTKREKALRDKFGLPTNAQLTYSRKGRPGPDGKNVTGWFMTLNGRQRYLGKSEQQVRESVASLDDTKLVEA